MEPQASTKIDEAALRCLNHCATRRVPRIAAARFIMALSHKPDWSEAEIAELRELIDWALGLDASHDQDGEPAGSDTV